MSSISLSALGRPRRWRRACRGPSEVGPSSRAPSRQVTAEPAQTLWVWETGWRSLRWPDGAPSACAESLATPARPGPCGLGAGQPQPCSQAPEWRPPESGWLRHSQPKEKHLFRDKMGRPGWGAGTRPDPAQRGRQARWAVCWAWSACVLSRRHRGRPRRDSRGGWAERQPRTPLLGVPARATLQGVEGGRRGRIL